jgi:hypothetical protein
MVPFQGAYLMIFALMFVILAGNHALVCPISTMFDLTHLVYVPESPYCKLDFESRKPN